MQCFGSLSVPVHKVALCSSLKSNKLLYSTMNMKPGQGSGLIDRTTVNQKICFSLIAPLKIGKG